MNQSIYTLSSLNNLLAHMFVIRKVSDVIQQPPVSFEVEIPQDPVSNIQEKISGEHGLK
jgi:hypothetical protein